MSIQSHYVWIIGASFSIFIYIDEGAIFVRRVSKGPEHEDQEDLGTHDLKS